MIAYIDKYMKYINNYNRVKPENITKLKLYMHNGLSIYQSKYCKTTFIALPCLSYILFDRPVVGKTVSSRQKSQQTQYHCRIATKLPKHINICCSFHKISMKRKKYAARKFDLTINLA